MLQHKGRGENIRRKVLLVDEIPCGFSGSYSHACGFWVQQTSTCDGLRDDGRGEEQAENKSRGIRVRIPLLNTCEPNTKIQKFYISVSQMQGEQVLLACYEHAYGSYCGFDTIHHELLRSPESDKRIRQYTLPPKRFWNSTYDELPVDLFVIIKDRRRLDSYSYSCLAKAFSVDYMLPRKSARHRELQVMQPYIRAFRKPDGRDDTVENCQTIRPQ